MLLYVWVRNQCERMCSPIAPFSTWLSIKPLLLLFSSGDYLFAAAFGFEWGPVALENFLGEQAVTYPGVWLLEKSGNTTISVA
jgi:hypothetical protein